MNIKKFGQALNNAKGKVSVAVLTMVASNAALADTATEISDAITNGTTNYGTVTAGVVSLAALGFGLGLIVRSLSR